MSTILDFHFNTDYYGLKVSTELTVRWTSHSEYEIERVFIASMTNRNDPLETVRVGMDVRDISDFYCAHADRIDQIIASEIASEDEYHREMIEEMRWAEEA